MSDREALSIPSFDDDLDDFAPRSSTPKPSAGARKAVDEVSQFPSREAPADAQLNLKGPRPVLDRFRALCKADRRSYYDMLEQLMDHYEGRAGGADRHS